MFDKLISDLVLSVLRMFVDVEWERLRLTFWSGAFLARAVSAGDNLQGTCSIYTRSSVSCIHLLKLDPESLVSCSALACGR